MTHIEEKVSEGLGSAWNPCARLNAGGIRYTGPQSSLCSSCCACQATAAMLPGDQHLPPRTDRVKASDHLHSELKLLEQPVPDDMAINMASVMPNNTPRNSDRDRSYSVGLPTESTPVVARNTDHEDEHRTGTSLGEICRELL